ncbi:MAG: hypothetical protein K9M45_04255 [Kiritimatiellales bacterium]|nr:hypothetical protein [Kiritimatiellales bacterium]
MERDSRGTRAVAATSRNEAETASLESWSDRRERQPPPSNNLKTVVVPKVRGEGGVSAPALQQVIRSVRPRHQIDSGSDSTNNLIT